MQIKYTRILVTMLEKWQLECQYIRTYIVEREWAEWEIQSEKNAHVGWEPHTYVRMYLCARVREHLSVHNDRFKHKLCLMGNRRPLQFKGSLTPSNMHSPSSNLHHRNKITYSVIRYNPKCMHVRTHVRTNTNKVPWHSTEHLGAPHTLASPFPTWIPSTHHHGLGGRGGGRGGYGTMNTETCVSTTASANKLSCFAQ